MRPRRGRVRRDRETVHPGDRRDEAETEAVARGVAGGLGPVEAAKHLGPLGLRDARSAIRDHDRAAGLPRGVFHPHRAAGRGELHRVVDQVRDRLEQEVAVALDRRQPGRHGEGQCDVLVLRHRLEELRRLAHHLAEIDGGEAGAAAPVLDLADAQDGGDHGEGLVDPGEALVDRRLQLGDARRPLAAALQPCPQAGERRAQVVRHRVADALDLVDEVLDLVEHPVHRTGEAVELVVGPPDGQAPAEIAAHHLRHRALGGGEPSPRPAGEHQAAEPRQDQGRHEAEAEGAQGRGAHPVDLVGVMGDHHRAAIGQRQGGGPDRVVDAALAQIEHGLDPGGVAVPGQGGGQGDEVAGPPRPVRPEQPGIVGGVPVHGDPGLDPLQRRRRLGGRGAHLEPQGLGQFLAHEIRRLPVDEGEHRQRHHGGPGGDAECPAEAGGAEEVRHRASGQSRCRARCGSAAPRPPPRACGAGGRDGRRSGWISG